MRDQRKHSLESPASARTSLVTLQIVFAAVLYSGVALPPLTGERLGFLATVGAPAGILLLLLTVPRTWLTTTWWSTFLVLGNMAVVTRVMWVAHTVAPWTASCAILLVGMLAYCPSILQMAVLSGLVSTAYGFTTLQLGEVGRDLLATLAVLMSLTLVLISRLGSVRAEIHHLTQQGEQTRHASMCDALTGLPNRAQFLEHVARSIQCGTHSRDFQFAVLFIDLDGFKPINDTLGHKAGDAVLHHVAKRLRGCLRKGDVAGRYGGDEFTLLINNVAQEGDAVRVAERVLTKIKEPMEVGKSVRVGASIGIAMSSNLHERPEDLIRDADGAMYRAKSLGKNQYVISEPCRDVAKTELKDRLARLALARW